MAFATPVVLRPSTASAATAPRIGRPRAFPRAAARPAPATFQEPVMAVASERKASVGLIGLAVMGQNLSLNVAAHGFPISVYNRTYAKTEDTVARAADEGLGEMLAGYEDVGEFVESLEKPRKIILLVKAGDAVDKTIGVLRGLLEEGDLIIDGGNEFYTNTERRAGELEGVGIQYMGMGVSGGEEGARLGPSLMPGGPKQGYDSVESLLKSIAAQVDDGPCVTYIGPRGAGNHVKMVHNGIEYGDMQLIGEVYDLMRSVGGMGHAQIADVFDTWNSGRLQSFLVEITATLLRTPDDVVPADGKALIDAVLDVTGSKGTGMWTVQEAAKRSVSCPTIAAALDARFLSDIKPDRARAASLLSGPDPDADTPALAPAARDAFVKELGEALYASKICSYAQGMNIIREAGDDGQWGLDLGAISRIWKGGCIIRAAFLDRIKVAYDKEPDLPSLLVDPEFASELAAAQDAWRSVVCTAVMAGVAVPALTGSLAYYDAARRTVLPSAQMVQSQRDFFGSHTYKRLDREGVYHTRWSSDGVTVRLDTQ